MKIKPLSNNIVVEQVKEERVKGSLLLQSAEKEGPQKGRVVSVGPGKKNSAGKIIPIDVKKGQIVLFSKYNPHEIKVGDKEYLILKEEDILCVIE